MTQFTLNASTQALISYALDPANGPGPENINYVNAYNAIYNELVANGGINAATLAWFQQAGIALITASAGKSEAAITADANHSSGMPPHGVADCVNRMWDHKATVDKSDTGADGIIGVKRDGRKMYDGLCHHMYPTGNKIYSWGKTYSGVTDADQVIWTIDVKP